MMRALPSVHVVRPSETELRTYCGRDPWAVPAASYSVFSANHGRPGWYRRCAQLAEAAQPTTRR